MCVCERERRERVRDSRHVRVFGNGHLKHIQILLTVLFICIPSNVIMSLRKSGDDFNA